MTELRSAPTPPPTRRGTRVLLFTDTYADVNGPSRFIQAIAAQAQATGRDLRVFTSTRMRHERRGNLANFAPRLAMKMPGYEMLDLTLPPLASVLRAAREAAPDVIHISTPGPVGLAGLLAARHVGCPTAGVYHTDFPSYVDRLFEDHVLTLAARWGMRTFYGSFKAIFTRSEGYAKNLTEMGIHPPMLVRLKPGIDLGAFSSCFRDEQVWQRMPGPAAPGPGVVRVLYCGRVSVEKGLEMLTRAWMLAHQRLTASGVKAELVIVGDGPYRPAMEQALHGRGARFVGFRFESELSALYASSDFFVFPSVTDTLGQVVMEAQASGLGVLVTDRGGPQEMVEDGITGRVLPAQEVEAWAGAIVTLASDPQGCRAMGARAERSMSGRSLAASFEHFWSVHEEVARRFGPGAARPPEAARR